MECPRVEFANSICLVSIQTIGDITVYCGVIKGIEKIQKRAIKHITKVTRKLCYRKDDRGMCLIYKCPQSF